MSRISLNMSTSTNLLSLQNVSKLMSETQTRLATGKKVNSAIDNPSSYYTARSLSNRASDLSALLDSMGQKIQTIQAAIEGIEAATSFLEQMTSVAEQAAEKLASVEGIVEIFSGMDAGEISSRITDNSIILLREDITLDDTLMITAKNVSFDGNGHSITFSGSGSALTATKAAIEVSGAEASADFKNIQIEASGDWAVGISSRNGATVTIDNTYGINMTGDNSYRISNRDELLYAGKYNTETIVNQIGADGLAAMATHEFYAPGVAADDETFGQGKWHLASLGELFDIYGYDKSQISITNRTQGAIGDNKATINDALRTLKSKGADAAELTNSWYWASSENDNHLSLNINMANGGWAYGSKKGAPSVRSSLFLEDVYNPLSGAQAAPQLGDIMYADKTWGKAADYDGSKTAVGVITNVSADGRDVTIINLKNLTFSSQDQAGNFNPATPYTGSQLYSSWATDAAYNINIENVKDYWSSMVAPQFKSEGEIVVTNTISDSGAETQQYNTLYDQYDSFINDSSYQGVNLLKGDSMEITFNEARDNQFMVQGQDISAAAIGLSQVSWITVTDVAQSLNEIRAAIRTLRSVASDLGNNNAIIQTRQDFTQNLINVLEEGADKLTLADMDEEAANMLALQTRQQLAINALSLASQADQSILKLF